MSDGKDEKSTQENPFKEREFPPEFEEVENFFGPDYPDEDED